MNQKLFTIYEVTEQLAKSVQVSLQSKNVESCVIL